MTKKKKINYSVQRELSYFIQRVLQLSNDYLDQRKKYKKKKEVTFKDASKIFGKKANEFVQIHDGYKDSTNALLIYAFSLYEIFISGFLKHLVNTNEDASNIYMGKWKVFIQQVIEGKHKKLGIDADFILNLTDKNKIEKYQVLLNSQNNGKGTTIGKFIRDLQSMGKISREDVRVKKNISKFAIYREVRNMLTHRGSRIDQKLIDSFRTNKDIGQDTKEVDQFLKSYLEKDKSKKIEDKDILGKEIDVNFLDVIEVIIFNAYWTVIYELKGQDDNKVESNFSSEIIHDCIIFNEKNGGTFFSFLASDIFYTVKKHIYDNSVKNLPDPIKFNYLLSHHQHIYTNEKMIKKLLKDTNASRNAILNKYLLSSRATYNKILNKYFLFDQLDQDIQNLLTFYLKNNKKDFIKQFKKINFSKEEIESWFIFKKYSRDKEFSLLATKKIKKNTPYFSN